MPILLEIILGLAILATFPLAYFSWKTWRVYQVILLEFVFLAAVAFSFLAVRTLKTHQSWRSTAIAWQNAVDKAELENQQLLEGKQEDNRLVEEGIKQLKAELQQLVTDRGSVWFEANPDKINADTGACQVSIEAPDPHEIAAKTILFVFDQQPVDGGGHYLGEFKVSKAPAKNKAIEIEPNLALTEEQKGRLKKAKGPWALYAMMPVDNAELFAGMDEAERQKLLPKSSLKEFADKGRPLRDYEYFFHQNALECELLADAIGKIKPDLERTLAAEKKTQDEIKYRESEKANVSGDLAKFRYERQAVTKYATALKEKLTLLRGELKTAFVATAQYAGQIKEMQLKAADEINRRSADQASNDRPPAAKAP